MKNFLSVVIPTHNPHHQRFARTVSGLSRQTLEKERWELVIIDNASQDTRAFSEIDFSWHPRARIIREEHLGLTAARIRGIQESEGEYIVFVDDDNVLDPEYLKHVDAILRCNPKLGAIGGKSLPDFEVEPEPWLQEFFGCLALRNLGEESKVYSHDQVSIEGQLPDKQYPSFAPVGAGMAVRRQAIQAYVKRVCPNRAGLTLDRTGKSLSSGGDNDMVLTILEAGWEVGYFPQLSLTHLIPANRLTRDYMSRLNRAISRTWVQVLDMHGIRPWKSIPRWSVFPRKVRAFFVYKPWKDPAADVRWHGACGMFESLARLSNRDSFRGQLAEHKNENPC